MPSSIDSDGLRGSVRGKRLGVAVTPAMWTPGVGCLLDQLVEWGDVRGFLGLEHGLRGELQAGVTFDNYTDSRTGLPVFSIYDDRHSFPIHFLASVDAVVFHAQDISHRAYSYKQALAHVLEDCAATGTELIVLDRPAPLGHLPPAGIAARQYFPLSLPMVIPLTLGELALWLRDVRGLDINLNVLPVREWRRQDGWPGHRLPWIPPSPNIPTLDSVYAYACTWMVQSTNVSEGRGTCRPFEYIGAPFVNAQALTDALSRHALSGVAFREICFAPTFGKFAGDVCAGCQMVLLDRRALDPVRVTCAVLKELARLHPDELTLDKGFDRRMGLGCWTRERLATMDVDAYLERSRDDGGQFAEETRPHRLYDE
ncbi:MAG: DUF1343 domain-containing protein [Lentisphaerae bacterium]|jgi:uncharacterized protein YbbC (DUF1343 family)|nr:DUF1343 domain-containing protein [Lentisphaerota bacterium]MBT5605114.1 DUF1343 domain-containing protein [Lentisphaerota bacterium]MBT7055996.1 DUF1343 domain-containing protein [Lentisphaerota bacterium]MBT7848149.1 DUF1343 domain-containing protein [Lentisphaerota bacterium]